MVVGSIQPLDGELSAKIRAGVLIRSPGQAAAELTANALDAGATEVRVEFDPTTFTISCSDNGRGMSRDDLEVVGQRSCTSKVRSEEDLKHPQYLGYRGLTLFSLAEISVLEIFSRARGSFTAYKKVVKGSKHLESGLIQESMPVGTKIVCHDLLYNLPVRRKQLRERMQEQAGEVRQQIFHLALAWPKARFIVFDSSANELLLDAQRQRTLRSSFADAFGDHLAHALVDVHVPGSKYQLSGVISAFPKGRHSKDAQVLCVNGLPMSSTGIHELVERWFKQLRQTEKRTATPAESLPKHPAFILFVTAPTKAFEVIESPEGRRVSFEQEAEALALVRWALAKQAWKSIAPEKLVQEAEWGFRQALPRAAPAPPTSVMQHLPAKRKRPECDECSLGSAIHSPVCQKDVGKRSRNLSLAKQRREGKRASEAEDVASIAQRWGPKNANVKHEPEGVPSCAWMHPEGVPSSMSREFVSQARCIAQIDRKYLALTDGKTLALLDQHAVDERVRLERMWAAALSGSEGVLQRAALRDPVALRVEAREAEMLASCRSVAASWGWLVQLEGDVWEVTAIPVIAGVPLGPEALEEAVREALEKGSLQKGRPPKPVRDALASRACKGAIKFNESISEERRETLRSSLAQCRLPMHCAHGRPTSAPLANLQRLRESHHCTLFSRGDSMAPSHRRWRPSLQHANAQLTTLNN